MFTINLRDNNIPAPFNEFSVTEEPCSTDIQDCIDQIRKMTDEIIHSWESVVTGKSDLVREFHEE